MNNQEELQFFDRMDRIVDRLSRELDESDSLDPEILHKKAFALAALLDSTRWLDDPRKNGEVELGKERLKKDIERTLNSAREIVDDRLEIGRYNAPEWMLELYHIAYEQAYEFDEDWAREIERERKKVEAECSDRGRGQTPKKSPLEKPPEGASAGAPYTGGDGPTPRFAGDRPSSEELEEQADEEAEEEEEQEERRARAERSDKSDLARRTGEENP